MNAAPLFVSAVLFWPHISDGPDPESLASERFVFTITLIEPTHRTYNVSNRQNPTQKLLMPFELALLAT